MSTEPALGLLADEVERVAALLRSVRDHGVPCLGEWSLAEVATHLCQAWVVVPALDRRDLTDVREVMPDLEPTGSGSLIEDVWDLGTLTMHGVEADDERDPVVLADRLEASASAFLGTWQASAGDHPWLVEGVAVSSVTLLGHLLNETVVHGFDIARADGRRWPVRRPTARAVLDLFVVPILDALGPSLVDQEAAGGLRAAIRLHVRGGGAYTFTFDDGALTVERDATGPVDCHISADPAGMVLVAWGRRSVAGALLRGQLMAWGRRPALALRFRSLLRNP